MTELLTAAQMRAIEQAAIASGEVTGLELMERAGRGVVAAIFEEWPELRATSHRAVVLCGPGNNGGDGFVVARLLKEWGWEVEVFLYGDPERLPPDARVNYERWLGMGEVVSLKRGVLGEAVDRAVTEEGADRFGYPDPKRGRRTIFIDALFGVGLNRPLPDDLGEIVIYEWSDECWSSGVAIDIPSGVCADSGRVLSPPGSYVCCKLTVTFEAPKVGHYLDVWSYDCPSLRCVDLGLSRLDDDSVTPVWLNKQLPAAAFDYTGMALNKLLDAHKYSHGHALILSGPSGRGGAARLAGRGALRIGAGVVTVGCPLDAIPEHAARLDAVMLRGVADGAALAEVLEDKRINALCLGPGMGVGTREAGLILAALEARRATVLDADALRTGFFDEADALFGKLHDHCVLTPHAGEFARLFPDISEKLAAPATTGPAYSKVDATREAAARAGCVVLYKGPDTVIAGPDGRCAINSAHYDRAAPWLATAGSGDVLAGFITGLLARGFSPFDAACTGAWLHVECALSFGPGLIAEDLPEELPKVFRALGM
jgi:hydroxyethylthiazole kinase-like uncharacterized protein yjeF